MKSLKLQLMASVCVVAFAGSASAADLPMKAGPAYIPTANWTGFYVGGHIGVGSSQSICGLDGPSNAACQSYYSGYASQTVVNKDTHFLGGIEGGYDWQHRNFVYGIAADWTWTNFKAASKGGSGSVTYTGKIDWLASFRGRMGLAVDDTMVYVTGGLAAGRVKDSHRVGIGSYAHESSETMVGWVAGVGVEHKFGRNWSVKGEYLHYDLGSYTDNYAQGGSNYSHKFSHQVDLVRLGLNYRF